MKTDPHKPTPAEIAQREVREQWVRIEQASLNVLKVAPDSEVAKGSLDLAREVLSRGTRK